MQAMQYSSLPEEGTGPYKFLIDNYDLISNISHYHGKIETNHESQIKYSHIYSHLNNKSKRDHILHTKGKHTLQMHLQRTTARNLNEACDKEAARQHSLRKKLSIPIKPQVITTLIKGLNITTKNHNFIHSITNFQNYEHYIKNKFQWTTEVFNSIDWKSLHKFMQTLTLEQKVSFIKYSHKWRPTNKKLHQMEYHQNETAECTLCGEIEDNDHLFQCKDIIMRDAQEETITNMCSSLQKINTSPYIIKTIKTHLKH